ncbi:MAG TPA: DUF87 domain-containing protein [Methylomirabilota bacterium]|nr:DUF87 domain-containing protein [Methylomirabilota bacterium]
MKLHVSPQLALPTEAITETFGILAARGAGKSNTAAVMAEEMFRAKLPFVVVDPVGCWWGLRSSGDGKGPGLPLPIFGGKRGDVPLERTGGQLLADLVVDQRLSCVLDLSQFESEGSKKAFLLEFARRLYQRNEAPLHLFLEEADDYIPQRPMRDEAQLLRAWENIVRRGRARGLGITLITQRSASLNKSVLTQVQTLIPMRTTGPQDIAAIREWVKYHHQGEDILASLAGLEDGEAWVWSPHFLRKTVRVRFRLRETFDSGATPKMTAGGKAPATLADVDLKSIEQRMAATIEKAKAEDPRELRRRIAGLEAELARAKAPPPPPAPKEKRVEVPVLRDAQLKRIEAALRTLASLVDRLEGTRIGAQNVADRIHEAATVITGALRARQIAPPTPEAKLRAAVEPRISLMSDAEIHARIEATGALRHERRQSKRAGGDIVLGAGECKMLEALALRYPMALSKAQLGLLSGYVASGGTFRTYLPRLRRQGMIDVAGDRVQLTAAGLQLVGARVATAPQTAEAVRAMWLASLDQGPRRMLEVLIERYPKPTSREELGEASGYAASGGTFRTYLPKLKRLGLVEVRGDEIRASEELFR